MTREIEAMNKQYEQVAQGTGSTYCRP